ncbi:BRCC3, partial [Cervus elaphus hippelaphus]
VDTVRIVHIHSVIILRRSDKRKDRVEISPEQLLTHLDSVTKIHNGSDIEPHQMVHNGNHCWMQ